MCYEYHSTFAQTNTRTHTVNFVELKLAILQTRDESERQRQREREREREEGIETQTKTYSSVEVIKKCLHIYFLSEATECDCDCCDRRQQKKNSINCQLQENL